MLRRNVILGLALSLVGIVSVTALIVASVADIRIANAAMNGDKDAVRSLLKQAADVNAAQGDGMTGLHWAAMNGDLELAQTLLYAGANVRATTRLGAQTPLFLAAKSGAAPVVELLLKSGSSAKVKAGDGLTTLMAAAMSGDRRTVRLLLDAGAEVNAQSAELGQTALIFAASMDRPDAIDELIKSGANLDLASTVRQPPPVPQRGFNAAPMPAPQGQQPAAAPVAAQSVPAPAAPAASANAAPRGGGPAPAAGATPPAATQAQTQPPIQQQPLSDARAAGGHPKGGLTPLMYAARDGNLRAARTLVGAGAKLDALSADKSSALLLAVINGKFDLAKHLVEKGANLNLASLDGAVPLYAVVHTQWSRESFHPQPSIKQEQTSYLDLMAAMLDHGADPNARLGKTLWYSSYGYAYESASEVGVTPFWRCAKVADIDGMKLLLSRGADPAISNKDAVNAFLAASGAGVHGNDEVTAPPGRMAALRYLVEDLHFDVNSADQATAGRQAPPAQAAAPAPAQVQQTVPSQFGGMTAAGYTALHNAASRGDNEMILYLVGKGAKVDAVTGTGITVADMANGPRQRVQPFPETVALLEMLGSRNSHKCVSC